MKLPSSLIVEIKGVDKSDVKFTIENRPGYKAIIEVTAPAAEPETETTTPAADAAPQPSPLPQLPMPQAATTSPASQLDRMVIEGILPYIGHRAHWMALYRIYVDYGRVAAGNYEAFCRLVERYCPEGFAYPVDKRALVKRCRGCFAKPFTEWDIATSPVQTEARYSRYFIIATFGQYYLSGDYLTKPLPRICQL